MSLYKRVDDDDDEDDDEVNGKEALRGDTRNAVVVVVIDEMARPKKVKSVEVENFMVIKTVKV